MLTSHGVFQSQIPLKNCPTSIWLSLLMVSSKVDLNFSQNCPAHITCSQKTISNTILHHWYKFPVQGYISIASVLRRLAWLKQNCFFMNWFYYNLIILIRYCKILYKNLDKAPWFSRNQVFCLKIWKLWRAPTTLQFNIFCWNIAHVSYLPMSAKGCVRFFSIR